MPHLRQCLSVDLGSNAVKIVELAIDKNSVRVLRAASAPTGVSPAMSAEEIRGAIVAATRDLLKKGRFGSRNAIFSISGQKVFIRRFRLPATSEERLARIIQYEARQQIPFPLDKTILQYQHRELPESGEVEVLLVAVRGDEVRDYMSMIQRTGLTPLAIGVSSFALFSAHHYLNLDAKSTTQLFESLAKKKKPAKAKKGKAAAEEAPSAEESAPEDGGEFVYDEVKGFVNIGATSYDLAIGRVGKGSGNLMFVRTVPTGGDEMTKAVMRACNIESFYDAERIKTSATQLLSFNFDFEGESQINQEASTAVTDVSDKVISEIRRSLDFFITQPDGMAIDALVLSGGQSQLAGFDSYFEEKLTIPVSIQKELPENSPIQWPASAGPITPYMIAIGLGLQGLGLSAIKVDFLPEERKIIRDFPYRVTAVMALLVVGIVLVSSQAGKKYAENYRLKEQEILQAMKQQEGQLKLFTETQNLHNEIADNYEKLDKNFGQRSFWENVIEKIAEVKPPEVLIEDLDTNHSGQVRIVGSSEIQVSAAYLVDALKKAFGDNMDVAEGKQPGEFIDYVNQKTPAPGQAKALNQFQITFRLKDKINHLKITPTPTPAAGGVQPGGRAQPGYGLPPGGGGSRGNRRQPPAGGGAF